MSDDDGNKEEEWQTNKKKSRRKPGPSTPDQQQRPRQHPTHAAQAPGSSRGQHPSSYQPRDQRPGGRGNGRTYRHHQSSIPSRPINTKGGIVDCNLFKIKLKDQNLKRVIYQYEVAMKLLEKTEGGKVQTTKDGKEKECPKKFRRATLLRILEEKIRNFNQDEWAYDGSQILFSCNTSIPDITVDTIVDTFKVRVTVVPTSKHEELQLENVGEKKLEALIQPLDIIMQNALANRPDKFKKVGRNFLEIPPANSNANEREIDRNLETWDGVFQSAILGGNTLYLNMDVVSKAVIKANRTVEEFFNSHLLNSQRPTARNKYQADENAQRVLRGLYINYYNTVDPARSYRVYEIAPIPTDATFVKGDQNSDREEVITVKQYFEEDKGLTLVKPYLPCLNGGNKDKATYLPMEFCEVESGQTRRMDDEQLKRLKSLAQVEPSMRKENIMRMFDSLKLKADLCILNFNIDIDDAMVQVKGKLLKRPKYTLGANGVMVDVHDSLGVNLSKITLKEPITKKKIAIVNLCKSEDAQRFPLSKEFKGGDFINELCKAVFTGLKSKGASLGLQFLDEPHIEHRTKENLLSKGLTKFDQGSKDEMIVVVIMPDKKCYAPVKKKLELEQKFLTQCILLQNAMKVALGDNYLGPKILLKINAKLNGNNYVICKEDRLLPVNEKKLKQIDNIMIMGADVSHPPPHLKSPSVAAVTASFDNMDMFRYCMQWRLQKPKQEIIEDMGEMATQLLEYYKQKNNGRLPRLIIFYRDGVDDGQFHEVVKKEVSAIHTAHANLSMNGKLGMIAIVVQKRHHVRFFPKEGGSEGGDDGNVLPGFVVDKVITRSAGDFFLTSHKCAKKNVTARPTKYRVVVNDFEDKETFDEDIERIQLFTYQQCHLFARFNSSVSYPIPTYYAHLSAARAKIYMPDNIKIHDETNWKELNSRYHDLQDLARKNPMYFV